MTLTIHTLTVTTTLFHLLAGLAAWLGERLAREG